MKIEASSKKFDISDLNGIGAKSLTISQLRNSEEFDKVNVKVKSNLHRLLANKRESKK